MIWKTTSAGSGTLAKPRRWFESGENRRQLQRFLVIGGASFLTDLLFYRLLGTKTTLPLDVAKGCSYLVGVVVGFVGNKWWTFRSARRSLAEPLSYLALYAVTMLVNIGCNRLALVYLGPTAVGPAFLFTTGVTTVLNFVGMRRFTFRQAIESHRAQEFSPLPAADLHAQPLRNAA
ncbi:MAG TPA: GtrA family protein [Pirellulales bacterium]|jgi:putative flippase GtrA